MRTDCIGSLREALRSAGLDDQYGGIPPRSMAERLRPPIGNRTSQTGDAFQQSRGRRSAPHGSLSVTAPLFIVVFILALMPSVAAGVFIWVERSRILSIPPCSVNASTELFAASNRF
jgi:hypothetical protein